MKEQVETGIERSLNSWMIKMIWNLKENFETNFVRKILELSKIIEINFCLFFRCFPHTIRYYDDHWRDSVIFHRICNWPTFPTKCPKCLGQDSPCSQGNWYFLYSHINYIVYLLHCYHCMEFLLFFHLPNKPIAMETARLSNVSMGLSTLA